MGDGSVQSLKFKVQGSKFNRQDAKSADDYFFSVLFKFFVANYWSPLISVDLRSFAVNSFRHLTLTLSPIEAERESAIHPPLHFRL